MPEEKVIGFKSLDWMASYLNDFLEKDFGISFHNQGGFYIRDPNGKAVYELSHSGMGDGTFEISQTFPFINYFFRASWLRNCCPDFDRKTQKDEEVIALGPEGTVWGMPRGKYEENKLDSRIYGPLISKVKLIKPNRFGPSFSFEDYKRVFWDKSQSI